MDWFKKSFRDIRSALGNLAAIASRAVLLDNQKMQEDVDKNSAHFLVTVMRSCVLR